jgi:ribonuclease HI
MAKKKIYAVKKGKKTGLFYTWEECKASVDGYPCADFKGFFTKEEAEAYLGWEQSGFDVSCETPSVHLVAYVDGSFNKDIGKYSFGCVLLTPDGEVIKKSGNGDNPQSLAIRNVAGEMLGAMFAVKWARKNGYPEIEICYDYEGIEKWATGSWRAKNDLTQKYAAYMQNNQKDIRIHFTKVAAHTGDYYNEQADRLAKAALTEGNGIPEI